MERRDDRRRLSRSSTRLKARYFLKEKKEGWKLCTIIDFSRKGMKILFNAGEKIDVGSTIHLEISVPRELEPVNVKGILDWIKQGENDLTGGITLTEMLDDIKWTQLG